MTTEIWKDVVGFEGRYQVSNLGQVRSVPFMQRYLLRNGEEAYRRTAGRILATQLINSGYVLAHLHLDNRRTAKTVHRLVAEAFIPGDTSLTVNHIDGSKTNNAAANLEWATLTKNHNHAVATGLNKQALKVKHPITGEAFPSIAAASRRYGKAARKWA